MQEASAFEHSIDDGVSEIVVVIYEPDPPRPVHVHRWAWRVDGAQECYDCGARR